MPNRSKPLSILVLCGGQSTEHDISLLSAKNVIAQLDKKKYTISIAKISHDGCWWYYKNENDFLSEVKPSLIQITPGQESHPFSVDGKSFEVDCVFPVLHGTRGEDGVIQGLLDAVNLPYVGADVLGSAVGMDKDIAKRLMRDAGIPVVEWRLVRKSELNTICFAEVVKQLGSPFFVKPNSLGSSVGTEKVKDEASFSQALQNAFRFDEYVLIESGINARELECSILGDENPRASVVGEIILNTEFYSFEAKYIDENAAKPTTPADISPELAKTCQSLAIMAFQALRCCGMARVDFFLSRDDGRLYLNEINTIPGFTNISMYPKNWEVTGVLQPALFNELVQIAMARFERKQSLERIFKVSKNNDVLV
jgi:D-alanine-D-alanine ligase